MRLFIQSSFIVLYDKGMKRSLLLPTLMIVGFFGGAHLCVASSASPNPLILAMQDTTLVPHGVSSSVLAYTRIFYYRQGGTDAMLSLATHSSSIDVLAPQVYSVDDTGALKGKLDPDVLAFAKRMNIKVMPLITNGSFGVAVMEAILNDPAKQDVAIDALVMEAKQQGYWGWQIDFEQMDDSYRDKYSAFIEKFGKRLKTEGLVSSVAVIAQLSSNPADYPHDLWHRIIGVYDYAALASSTDIVTIMSYDDPVSKGPIARYTWLEQVLAYSLKYIPKQKLSLGIPLYYWKWDDDRGRIVGIGGYEGIKTSLSKRVVTYGYDNVEQAPYYRYTEKKKHYSVWYENKKSIAAKIDLIKTYQLHGFSAWVLGLEMPEVYTVMK